jgi:pentapeptide MXKDX repeat protein
LTARPSKAAVGEPREAKQHHGPPLGPGHDFDRASDKKNRSGGNCGLRHTNWGSGALPLFDPRAASDGGPVEVSFVNKILALSGSLVAFGFLFAPAAQAEDTMMKKDTMHMSKPAHHMKKNTIHKESMMKDDKMMKDDAPKN